MGAGGAHGRDQILDSGGVAGLVFQMSLAGCHHVLPSTDVKLEAQKGQVTSLRSYSQGGGG